MCAVSEPRRRGFKSTGIAIGLLNPIVEGKHAFSRQLRIHFCLRRWRLLPNHVRSRARCGGVLHVVPIFPAHHWFYVPEMQADEAILIKCYDSAGDMNAHSSELSLPLTRRWRGVDSNLESLHEKLA